MRVRFPHQKQKLRVMKMVTQTEMSAEVLERKYRKSMSSHIGDMKRTLFHAESYNLRMIRNIDIKNNVGYAQKEFDRLQDQLNEANKMLQAFRERNHLNK